MTYAIRSLGLSPAESFCVLQFTSFAFAPLFPLVVIFTAVDPVSHVVDNQDRS